jgi:hypothetical protein
MKEKIRTLHPDANKKGTYINMKKYEIIKDSITRILRREGKTGFSQLGALIKEDLKGKFDGSVSWYYTTVKLDLEARGVLVIDRSGNPQMISLRDG